MSATGLELAATVTRGAVRCSAWLGVAVFVIGFIALHDVRYVAASKSIGKLYLRRVACKSGYLCRVGVLQCRHLFRVGVLNICHLPLKFKVLMLYFKRVRLDFYILSLCRKQAGMRFVVANAHLLNHRPGFLVLRAFEYARNKRRDAAERLESEFYELGFFGCHNGNARATPNDPKLSDGGAWRGACPTMERTETPQM